MINKKEKTENGSKETARLEAFSDGVFAIAITLLVLELVEILHIQNRGGLLKTYLNHWESFLAFFIGFCTILVCWINHHHIFTYIHNLYFTRFYSLSKFSIPVTIVLYLILFGIFAFPGQFALRVLKIRKSRKNNLKKTLVEKA